MATNPASSTAGQQMAQDPNIPGGRTIIVLLGFTAAITAGVLAGMIIMALASRMDPPLLPPAPPDHQGLTPHPEGYMDLFLHAERHGERADASYTATVTRRDRISGNLKRMLHDAAARRGWLPHRETMLVLPAADLPELERASADLTAWLIRDHEEGGEPIPAQSSGLANASLKVETTGDHRTWLVVGTVLLGIVGGGLALILLSLSVTETKDYLRKRAQRG